VIVAAGRLVHLKAFSLAVRALAETNDPRMHLVVAGEGPQGERLERLAVELGVRDQIELTGLLPRRALLERFAGADVLLFPSLHDESPLVVVEAMAQGAVPIVLDLGGSATLVGSAGFVVPARDRNPRAVVSELALVLREASRPGRLDDLRGAARERARSLSWSNKVASLAPIVPERGPRIEVGP
jgi:glycosyltransferase involved in cell wall biosynthesis